MEALCAAHILRELQDRAGFGIRILPSGRRRLFVHAQRDVRCRWTTVGDAGTMPLAEARALPRLRLAAMASGVTSPPEDASAETPFEDAAFRRHARLWKPGTLAVNRSYLMNHILPRFRGHPIAAITGADTGFGRRLQREAVRNSLFGTGGLVVIPDGADWIGNVTREPFPCRPVPYVLDFLRVTERLSDAQKAILPDPAGRRRRFEADRDRLKASGVAEVIAALRPHAARNGAVSGCVRYMQANVGRMQYGTYPGKGLRIGSGVVEGACRKLVCERCRKTGSRWPTKGANPGAERPLRKQPLGRLPPLVGNAESDGVSPKLGMHPTRPG